jgi:hypothetical protein
MSEKIPATSTQDSAQEKSSPSVEEAFERDSELFAASSEALQRASFGKPESRREFRTQLSGMIEKIQENLSNTKIKETKARLDPKKSNENAQELKSDEKQGEFESIKQAEKLAVRAGVAAEYQTVHELERQYLDQYKKANAKGAVFSMFSDEKAKLSVIKQQYDEARLSHAKAIDDSLADRLRSPERVAKFQKLYDNLPFKDTSFEDYYMRENQKLVARYNGWIRFNEIIKPSIEAQQNARAENLDKKGKTILGKVLNRYQESNKWLENKFGRYGARAVRILSVTAIATGTAVTLGEVAFAGAAAYAGGRLGRAILSTVIGSAVSGLAGKGFENTIGKNTAKKLEKSKIERIRSLKDLKRHESLNVHGTKAGIERNRQKVEFITAVLAGVGYSHALAAELAGTEAVQKGLEHAADHMPSTAAPAPFAEAQSTSTPNVHEHVPSHHHHTAHHHPHHRPHHHARQTHATPTHAEKTIPANSSSIDPDRSAEIAKMYSMETGGSEFHPTAEYPTPDLYAAGQLSHPDSAVHSDSSPALATPPAHPNIDTPSPDASPEHSVDSVSAPATAESASSPEHIETSAPPIENAPASVDALAHNEFWSQVHNHDSYKVASIPAEPGTPAAEFRTQLFSLVRESGVGPNPGETLDQYATRAAQAIHDHAEKGISSFDARPGIYEGADHHLQVHGGDLNARILVAQEYKSLHPSSEIVVENPGGETPLFIYSNDALASGHFPDAGSKLSPITEKSKLVF